MPWKNHLDAHNTLALNFFSHQIIQLKANNPTEWREKGYLGWSSMDLAPCPSVEMWEVEVPCVPMSRALMYFFVPVGLFRATWTESSLLLYRWKSLALDIAEKTCQNGTYMMFTGVSLPTFYNHMLVSPKHRDQLLLSQIGMFMFHTLCPPPLVAEWSTVICHSSSVLELAEEMGVLGPWLSNFWFPER